MNLSAKVATIAGVVLVAGGVALGLTFSSSPSQAKPVVVQPVDQAIVVSTDATSVAAPAPTTPVALTSSAAAVPPSQKAVQVTKQAAPINQEPTESPSQDFVPFDPTAPAPVLPVIPTSEQVVPSS